MVLLERNLQVAKNSNVETINWYYERIMNADNVTHITIRHDCHRRIRVSTLQSSSTTPSVVATVVEIKCKYCKVETTLRKVLDLHLPLRNTRCFPRRVSLAIGNKYETKLRLSCGSRSITGIPSALFKNFGALSAYVASAISTAAVLQRLRSPR